MRGRTTSLNVVKDEISGELNLFGPLYIVQGEKVLEIHISFIF